MKTPTVLLLGATAGALLTTACTTTPTITRERTTMTRAEIAESGLVCRRERPANTNIPRTVCASEQAWASFDERRRLETDELMSNARSHSNVGRFNRD